jgi:16S rRNA C967 or C1407 C5-methylase (RsmB/RsmF family)
MQFPPAFVERIQHQFPQDFEAFFAALDAEAYTSIRLNSHKNKETTSLQSVPWSSRGFYLPIRPQFTLDPTFHAGAYYVQEASSMFLDTVLEHIKKDVSLDRVLDMCAAPGGKSTLILDHLTENQFLIANEIVDNRNAILRENLTKWGFPNFAVTQNDAKHFGQMTDYFDAIFVDAPCSGEGLFRKDEKARAEWTPENVQKCSVRQMDILENIWEGLKPNGYLIYSTCTYNPEENETLLYRFKQKGYEFESIEISLDPSWNITKVDVNGIMGYAFLPHKTKGEGFFCSVLKKTSNVEAKNWTAARIIEKNEWIEKYIQPQNIYHYTSFSFQESIAIVPKDLLAQLGHLRKHLYFKQFGLPIGSEMKGDFIPDQGLALCSLLDLDKVSKHEVSKYEALQFLSKEAFDTSSLPLGFILLIHNNISLGWIKNISGRHNNLYPKSWRILMDWKSRMQ